MDTWELTILYPNKQDHVHIGMNKGDDWDLSQVRLVLGDLQDEP